MNFYPPASNQEPSELDRILALPIMDPKWAAPDLTPYFRRVGGCQELRPIQSKALYMAAQFGGLFGPIGVGFGKTLTASLLPIAMGASRPMLMIPPSQRADLAAQWQTYARHWNLPRNLDVRTYELLSQPDSSAMLSTMRPDLLIFDEAHKLSDQKSARTRRVARYLAAHPETKVCVLSGSFTAKSIKDYAHLAAWALGNRSPLPLTYGELEIWARALDVFRNALNGSDDDSDTVAGRRSVAQTHLSPLCSRFGTEDVREAYQRRLMSCPGVVGTRESAVDIPIYIHKRTPTIPESVVSAVATLQHEWKTPAGEEIEDALAFNRVARQVSLGFYYKWVWPNSAPNAAEKGWLLARAAWHRALRAYLPESREGRDSPYLAAQACIETPHKMPGAVLQAWKWWASPAWQTLQDPEFNAYDRRESRQFERYDHPRLAQPFKDWPNPPTEVVWLDGFAVYDAIQWAHEQGEPSLIWYEHTAFGQAVAQVGGFTFADVGPDADHLLATLREPRTIVLSIDAHGTGKNLQLWRRKLVTAPPANGRIWEQLIGRCHRPGQKADRIDVTYNAHVDVFKTSMRNARDDARYIAQTMNTPQKLDFATFSD